MTAASQALKVGDKAPAVDWLITQEVIDLYADASGDHNPIHVDPEYSAKGPFGRTIAHGLMTLACAAQVLNRWTDGDFDSTGEIEVTFVGPVFVDERIVISAVVETVGTDGFAECELLCMANERKILVGKVRLLITADKNARKGELHGA